MTLGVRARTFAGRVFGGVLWHNSDFLKLWSGQTVSLLGSHVGSLALPLVAILTLRATPFQIGLMTALGRLPYLLIALPLGVWIDRTARRRVLVASDVWRAVVTLSIPIAAFAGWLGLTQLFVATFLIGVGTVAFEFAYGSYLPHLVGRDQLMEGNSKLQLSQSSLAVAGPGVGGLLVQALTAPAAVLVDGLSFFASAGSLLLIRRRETLPDKTGERNLLRELREGFDFVRSEPFIRAQVATTATFNIFASITFTLDLLYLVHQLHFQPALIGLVGTLGAPGAIVGTLAAGPAVRRLGIGPTMIAAAFVNGLACLLVPVASGPGPFAVLVMVAFGFVFGVAVQMYNITAVTVRQAITPDRLLGRMNGTTRFITWGIIPIASLAAGVLGDRIGLRAALVVGGIGASTAFVWQLLSPARRWKTVEDIAPNRT